MGGLSQLDPLSLIIAADNGAILYFSRKYDAAIEKWRSVQDMDPGFMRAHLIEGAYVEKRMFAEALADNEKVRPTISDAAYWSWRAYILGRAGQMTEAHSAIHKLLETEKSGAVDPPIGFAQSYAGTGDKDQALAWLEKAYAQRSNGLTSLKVDPAYDLMRGDQRFEICCAYWVRPLGLPLFRARHQQREGFCATDPTLWQPNSQRFGHFGG